MLTLARRRKRKRQQQVADSLRSIEASIYQRVAAVVRARGTAGPEDLSRSVVNRLLGKTPLTHGDESGVVTQIAGELVAREREVRDATFISLQAMLAVAGENKNFDGERCILETIQWLKGFGEIPQTSHDSETLKSWAKKLQSNVGAATFQNF